MDVAEDRVFTVKAGLCMEQLQDAVIERLMCARAMTAVLQSAEAGSLGPTVPMLYGQALDDVLQQLDLLFGRMLELPPQESQTPRPAPPPASSPAS